MKKITSYLLALIGILIIVRIAFNTFPSTQPPSTGAEVVVSTARTSGHGAASDSSAAAASSQAKTGPATDDLLSVEPKTSLRNHFKSNPIHIGTDTAIPPPIDSHGSTGMDANEEEIRMANSLAKASKIYVPPLLCTGSELWCSIPMPKKSLFRFDQPPTDHNRWVKAQIQAKQGDMVLLQAIKRHFHNHMNFLDGDTLFRQMHLIPDYFVDKNTEFKMLTKDGNEIFTANPTKALSEGKDAATPYRWEDRSKFGAVLPSPLDLQTLPRAPIVQLGYFAFSNGQGHGDTRSMPYFLGANVGEASIDHGALIKMWRKYRTNIDKPFVLMHAANENWGILSTHFPNRTVDWGSCCTSEGDEMIKDMLEHEKLLMFVVNQHSNLTHPKIVTLPRGIPLHGDNMRKKMFDTQLLLAKEKKVELAYTSSSNWGPRTQIAACVAQQFVGEQVNFNVYGDEWKGRLKPHEYYHKLGLAMFSIAWSGLGYDTHRIWESLTLGTIPVIERGVGLDKPTWKLPVLLVDDFIEVTPTLLRTAYVEALYRVEEFEFERLTQSFWLDFINNVSVSKSSSTVLEKFPLGSEVTDFTRPAQPFTCWEHSSCGAGTKRIPRQSC